MKKEKKDNYLEFLFAQHPDWGNIEDPNETLCLYVVLGSWYIVKHV